MSAWHANLVSWPNPKLSQFLKSMAPQKSWVATWFWNIKAWKLGPSRGLFYPLSPPPHLSSTMQTTDPPPSPAPFGRKKTDRANRDTEAPEPRGQQRRHGRPRAVFSPKVAGERERERERERREGRGESRDVGEKSRPIKRSVKRHQPT